MRLIDADELPEVNTIEGIEGERDVFVNSWIPASAIWKAPTVDAVPVVRCKDCKYASPNGKYGCKAYHFKLYETHEMEADDFCSRGERK